MKKLSDLGELTLASRLKKLSDQFFDDVDKIYKKQGIKISSRCFPIIFLLHENGDSGITQLAEQLEQAHSSVSQMSRKLVNAGYIENKTDVNDERRRLLGLTRQGRLLIDRMTPIWEDIRFSVKAMFDASEFNFLSGLAALEQQQTAHPLVQRLNERQILREAEKVEIIPFEAQYRDEFKRLNVEWLEKYFYVEEIDNRVLSEPEDSILKSGGFIFFAKYNQQIVGTAALIKVDDNTFELSKMSVTEKYQGLKIGRRLAQHAIRQFNQTRAKILFLESNSRLQSALKLYEKLGFEHRPKKSDSHYQRADVYMVYNAAIANLKKQK